ncbi:MAG: hypothetical protein LUM44_17805 [Pyrinomonadaceae bacterium]|nr:hypothetical protein [Pyrinomonadaceae bacterium]
MKRVLIGCERFGVVREAFKARGWDAWSCDIAPSAIPGNHIQGDILRVLQDSLISRWDLMIFHPPCTYLTNSGVRWLWNKDGSKNLVRWENLEKAAMLFKSLLNSNCERIAVENPIPHRYAKELIGQDYTQIIHPYQFGHLERKSTCLWLKGLPKLQPTNDVKAEMLKLPKNEQHRLFYLPPSSGRAMLRSKTFQGIANAMAEQWNF